MSMRVPGTAIDRAGGLDHSGQDIGLLRLVELSGAAENRLQVFHG